jgi:hypothetical protein
MVIKDIKSIDGSAVRCGAEQCEVPARFLFIAAGTSGGLWAYCDEHAKLRACHENLQLPATERAAAAAY